jgi:putative restriction endonuclease
MGDWIESLLVAPLGPCLGCLRVSAITADRHGCLAASTSGGGPKAVSEWIPVSARASWRLGRRPLTYRMSSDLDWQLRLAAFAHLEELKRARGGVVTAGDLEAGFPFKGETVKFWSSRRGIWRPRQLSVSGAALSITTTPPKPGKKPPYEDQIAPGAELFIYRYEGSDPQTYTNVAVRKAMTQRRPLIYLIGLEPGLYEAIFPCYVVADRPGELAFEIAADVYQLGSGPLPLERDVSAGTRRYATRVVTQRLHQYRFRQLVVAAYRERCAVCRLGHAELLDAAHILPDRDQRGRPEVPNGLSLCKIHHSAYDTNILGVDPDYLIHIRGDVLEEEDGPMLLYGLQGFHGLPITAPKAAAQRPNRDYLAERFGRFEAA